MTLNEIRYQLTSPMYDFLKTNSHLNDNIILLALGGSYAYGTNIESAEHVSDIDIRGIALNSKSDILLGNDFEQVEHKTTDTVIYSFNKMIRLLTNCNPNTIEILGCRPEHYFYKSDIGNMLLDNKHLFLSKRAIKTFCGYAHDQAYRLTQKTTKDMNKAELEQHILNKLSDMCTDFRTRYTPFDDDNIKLYIDKSEQVDYDTEIFMDINLTHYPVRDYCNMWNELQNTVRSYTKINKKDNEVPRAKIAKHSMHLLRLYMMCLDILEKEQIITYREKEHDLLMDVRNEKYLDSNNKPIPEFFEIVHDYEKKLDYAKQNTNLPENPDIDKINQLKIHINNMIVQGK